MGIFIAFSRQLCGRTEYWAKLCVSAGVLAHILTTDVLMLL